MRYVSYTRSEPNNEYSDISYYNGITNGTSALKLQEKHIKTYADNHNMKILKNYTDTNTDAAFKSLLSDGMERKFDGVIVDSIDRCGATLWQAREILLETFQYAGISFIVVKDNFNSEKGNKAAESYFKEKYKAWKSSLFHSEEFIKNRIPSNGKKIEKTKKKTAPHARSPLTGLIFNAKTDKPFKMKTINGTQYFLRSSNIPKRIDGNSLPKEKMESIVMDALDKEKKLAESVMTRLKNGEGKEISDRRLSIIGARMKQEFDRLAEAEFAEVEYTRAYERGEIDEEEYRQRRTAQRDALLEADKVFQETECAGDKLEKTFGFTNPWITLMLSWECPKELTRAMVKKYIKKAEVSDFKEAEIITTADDWKRSLPAEWLN